MLQKSPSLGQEKDRYVPFIIFSSSLPSYLPKRLGCIGDIGDSFLMAAYLNHGVVMFY